MSGPDLLLGWRLDEAVAWLRGRGLEPRVRFTGPPRRPDPPPGRPCRVVRVRETGSGIELTAAAEAMSPEDVLGNGGAPCAEPGRTGGNAG